MYKVEITEHFEDWYVADISVGEFDSINEAISVFFEECRKVLENKYSISWIETYISETFGNDTEDDVDIDQYSKGVIFWLYNDDGEEIISQNFEYNHKSHSMEDSSRIELHHENITETEANVLADFSIFTGSQARSWERENATCVMGENFSITDEEFLRL